MTSYLKTDNQIGFLVDEEIAKEIATWVSSIKLSEEQVNQRLLSVDGGLGLTYEFRFTDDGKCLLKIKHPDTGDVLELAAESKESTNLANMTETSWGGKLSPVTMIIQKIEGKEYQDLINWESWSDAEALTSRYIYKFTETALTGGTGGIKKVEDTTVDNQIMYNRELDITNYNSW